ncbi:hypothetical protein CMI47_22580 [Candidatus Pacearchaeota archaeon]|nr:hypothetical protein [Candidatus Pacearchaeota archaeon]
MEGWRGYLVEDIVGKPLLEDYEYITGVLGVQLPLNESGDIAPLTEELKQQILQEQMLFEAFWDGAVEKVKTVAGQVAGKFIDAVEGVKQFGKDGWIIIQQLYRVSSDPSLIQPFSETLWTQAISNIKEKVTSVLQQLIGYFSEWSMPSLSDITTKAVDIISKLFDTLLKLEGWKKAVGFAGMAIGMAWLWDKVKDFVEPYLEWVEKIKGALDDAKTQIVEEFKAWVQDTVKAELIGFIQGQFGSIIDKLISVTSGIKPWWDAAVKAVGTAELIVRALGPSMKQFATVTTG